MNIIGVSNTSTYVAEDVVSFAINRTGKHFLMLSSRFFLMVQNKGVGMSKLLSAGQWVPQVLFLFEICSFPELLLMGGGGGKEEVFSH